jgi:hypothetical protein
MTTRRLLIKKSLIACIPVLLIICSCVQAMAGDVQLAWDANENINVSGYKVYVGSSSRTYNAPTPIPNQTSYIVTGLPAGTWYFSVTATDASGNESGFSNEVVKTVSGASVPCDVNGDSSVNSVDLQSLTNVILLVAPSSGTYDINHDSNVNAVDLQVLNNVVIGAGSCP